MSVYYQDEAATVIHADALAAEIPGCDLLVADAPYSDKTHAGHDNGTAAANHLHRDGIRRRRRLQYACWGDAEVGEAVRRWSPRTRGWFITVTDDVLAPVWAAALERAGRYVFAPLPFVARGSRVRLTGDGPSGWTTWIVVARPRTPEYVRWGTLDGAYVLPPGQSERMDVVGGKPLWLGLQLVKDYSRPGETVCDPCCGGGTFPAAAKALGRKAIGIDISEEHCAISAKRVAATKEQVAIDFGTGPTEQLALAGSK